MTGHIAWGYGDGISLGCVFVETSNLKTNRALFSWKFR